MMQKRMIAAMLLCCGYASLAQAAATPEKTEVIKYVPAVPSKTAEGSCWTSSIAAPGSPYAWRCMVENAIYDPCLTATDGKTIVCGALEEEFAMKLTEPLPKPDEVNLPPEPWQIELADGVICAPFTGTMPPIEETARYGCNDDDNSALLEDLQQNDGGLWQARRVIIEPKENPKEDELPFRIAQETLVPILKIWFAGDPKEAQ